MISEEECKLHQPSQINDEFSKIKDSDNDSIGMPIDDAEEFFDDK